MIFGLTVPNTFAFTITNTFAFTITNAQVVREDKDWERRAGMILEVKLRNFKFLSSENGIGNSTVNCKELLFCFLLMHSYSILL